MNKRNKRIKEEIRLYFLLIVLAIVVIAYLLLYKAYDKQKTELLQQEEMAEEMSRELPKGAELFCDYPFVEDGNYKIYQLEDTYYLCHKECVLDTINLKEKVQRYNQFYNCPFAFSEKTGNLYMIQMRTAVPRLDFIKVAKDCEVIGTAKSMNCYFPIYQKEGKMFLVLPSSMDSYKRYAIMEEEQNDTYSLEYETIEMPMNEVLASISLANDKVQYWAVNYFFTYEEKEYCIEDLPKLEEKAKLSKPYVYYVMKESNSKACKKVEKMTWRKIQYPKFKKFCQKLQKFLVTWEKKHPEQVFRAIKKDTNYLLWDGAKEWMKAHPKYQKTIFLKFGKDCFEELFTREEV